MSISPVKKMLGISSPEESTARPSGSLTVRKEVDVAIIGTYVGVQPCRALVLCQSAVVYSCTGIGTPLHAWTRRVEPPVVWLCHLTS